MTRSLRRLANIETNPRVSLLVDHYEEDWTALWWVRVDGNARIVPVESAEGAAGVAALVAKYPQYQAEPPPGPVVVIAVAAWLLVRTMSGRGTYRARTRTIEACQAPMTITDRPPIVSREQLRAGAVGQVLDLR